MLLLCVLIHQFFLKPGALIKPFNLNYQYLIILIIFCRWWIECLWYLHAAYDFSHRASVHKKPKAARQKSWVWRSTSGICPCYLDVMVLFAGRETNCWLNIQWLEQISWWINQIKEKNGICIYLSKFVVHQKLQKWCFALGGQFCFSLGVECSRSMFTAFRCFTGECTNDLGGRAGLMISTIWYQLTGW